MNINFHYFAVKTLCRVAGMSENDAQLIANYSQFVDDYSVWENYKFLEVPGYAMHLVLNDKPPYEFYTVTTGFTNFIDDARLVIEKYQKEIAVPFHFIPKERLRNFPSRSEAKEYRTVAANLNNNDLICQLLYDAKSRYINSHGKYDLMRIGLLLHIFADTYAHQLFSGFHKWVNFSYLTKVIDHRGAKDITSEYNPDFFHVLPSIGHANVNTAPDDPYVTWKMKMASNCNERYKEDYTLLYERNNPKVFFQSTCWEILRFICQCLGKPMVDEKTWMDLDNRLVNALVTSEDNVEKLEARWHMYFPEYQYSYNKESLWQDALIPIGENGNDEIQSDNQMPNPGEVPTEKVFGKTYKTATDDFFHYNVIAKEIRDVIID